MPQLFANNAVSTLASGITNVATSLSVAAGTGALFPNPSTGEWFLATLESGSTREIVKVTARATDAFTVVRAQEGTSGVAWSGGATIRALLTAGSVKNIGAMQEIASVTTTGSQSTVSFQDIPATFRDLLVVVSARGTASAGEIEMRASVNNDSTSGRYRWFLENRFGSGNSTTSGFLAAGSIPAATATADTFGFTRLTFPSYKRAARKQVFVEEGHGSGTDITGAYSVHSVGWYSELTAIGRLDFSVSSGAFADNSEFTLYGVGRP